MMHFTDMTGLAGNALALAAAAAWLSAVARMPGWSRVVLSGVVFIAVLVPFGGFPMAAYLRGVIGDLSVTTLVLLVLSFAGNMSERRRFDSANHRVVQLLALVAALWLYPMALGLGYFDSYRPGYGDPWFLAVLLIVALIALYRRHRLAALVIALAVSAWTAGWYESANLWDYLLDPLAALYTAGALARSYCFNSIKCRRITPP